MSHEKAIAAALEPLVDDIVRLEATVKALQLQPGPKGDPGAAGDPGAKGEPGSAGERGAAGADGAGITSPVYESGGVYREGTVVVANLGQHFRALRDTAASPDDAEHWQRLGSGGFRHRGTFKADAAYVEGDLFLKDFGTFAIINGAPICIAGRGSVGQKGERGPQGERGKDGRNGAEVIGAQVKGLKLVIVQQDADGSIDHIEADFGPALRELVRELVSELTV